MHSLDALESGTKRSGATTVVFCTKNIHICLKFTLNLKDLKDAIFQHKIQFFETANGKKLISLLYLLFGF